MPINFPIPSFVGELYTFGQTTWEWSGEYWGVYSAQTGYVYSVTTSTGLSGDTTQGNITLLNTSPDQLVTISGGTGILTGGTYPNFTITNTAPDQIVTLNNGQYISVSGTYPNFTIATTGITDNDKFTTGFTYNNNTFTLIDNSGNTLSSTINDVTGLTVNGDLTVTGNSYLNTVTASTITNVDYIDFDITQTGTTSSPGRLFWDVNNRTLSLGMLSGVTQQIGEEQYYLVENQTSGTLSDGTVVRAVGTTGSSGKLLVDYMISNGTIPAFTTMGVLTQTLLSGETGYVTSFGLVRNIDTTGTPYGETWNQGDILYVSSTYLGGFTNIKPITPNQDIIIGIVMEQGVNGSIFVRPDIYRPFKDPNTITVAKENADFTSVKDAVNSITGATSANTYTVRVLGGVYYEDPFTIPSYVAVNGDTSISTVIQANDPSQTLINLSDQSGLFDCQIQGCTGTSVSAIVYSSSTTPQSVAISYVENVRFGANYTHAKVVAFGGANIIMQCSNVKYGGYPFTVGFYATNSGSGVGRMQLRNVTSTNGGIVTTPGLIFAKADAASCGFIVNGCLLTKSAGAAAGTGFYVENGGFLRLTAVNFQRWTVGIDAPQIGSAPSIDAIALNFENNTIDVNIVHSGATGKIQGTDNFLKTIINQNAPLYEVNQDPKEITVAKKGGDFSSIKAAVDYLIASGNTSSTNRYVISVGPGVFIENEIDLTQTPYVSIVGSNIQTTQILPNTNTQHIIKIGINNEISFLSLSGASAGYAGIYCYDIGDFGQAHKISMYDCDTNIWIESDTQDTKFYGEYIDYNGEYTYGTKVIGNNGYLALANMENYFNFPTGGNITYCNYASGSGATLSVFVGDNQSNGISGSTAFYAQDGAGLYCSTITVDGFTYGVWNPNIGDPIRFDIDNASFVSGEWDLYVERIGTFGTFGGSSNHEKVFTASEDVYWAFLDIEDGEFDITRKASVTFTDGSHTDFTTLIFEGSTMGLLSGGSLTTISGFTVQADGGFGYLEKSDNSGIVRRIDWLNNQITLSANSDNYIYINENSNLVSSGTKPITFFNILLGRVVTNSTGVEFIDLSPLNAEHTSNRFDSLFTEALGPIYSEGSIVTEGVTPFTIDVTQGDYHFSTNEFLPSGGTNINFIQYYRNGTGTTWVTSATTLVNNTQYDNNGTLTGLTAGYFTKHTLYTIGQGSYENYFLVLGQNEYSTLVEAEDALLPTPPTYFSDGVVQIANIYIEQGSSGITQVEDVRPTIGFRAGGVNASSVHGNLLGLGADDHIQYLLVSGARAMSGNLDMGTNDITNVGTVDGVTVSAHATRHQFGGLDPVGSVTPSANAIPYADVSGTLNDWVSTASTTTFGKVKTSSSSTTVISDNDLRFLNSFTGGSYSNGTISFTNNSGGTYNVTGLFTGGTDVFVTGGTYSNGAATFRNNTGGTFNVTGLTSVNGSSPQVGFFSSNTNLTGSNNLTYTAGTLTVNSTGSTTSSVPFRVRNNTDTTNLFEILGDGSVNMGQSPLISSQGHLFTIRNGLSTAIPFIYTSNNAYDFDVDRFANIKTNFNLVQTNATGSLVLGLGTAPTSRNFQQTMASLTAISQGTNDSGFAQTGADTSGNNAVYTNYYGRNIVLGSTTQGTGTQKIVLNSGTAPTTNLTDSFQQYSADIVAGKAAPHFRTEDGDIVKLYTHSAVTTTQGIANVLTTLGLLSASTITSATDVFVTGGTYSNGSATFTNNTGGTFNVTGFYTGQTSYVNSLTTGTGLSANTTTGNITLINTSPDQTVVLNNGTGISTSGTYPNFTITNTAPDQTVTISGGTGILTGGTYPNFTITNTAPDQTVVLNNGTGISVTGTYPSFTISSTGSTGETFTGGTVTGNTVFTQGLTATTISATTYQNLPTDIRVTGGTYNNSTGTATFTNNTGGTFNVSGFITGGTSGVSGDYLPLSGGTVTGNTVFTQGLTGNTISGTSIFVDTIDSFNRILRESNGDTRVVWGDGQLYNSSILKLDWNNGYLNDSSGVLSVDWENMQLFDTVTPIISVDWRTRNLIDAGGNIKLDWQTGVLSGMTNVQSTTISATTYQNLPTDIRVTGGTYDNLTGSATFTNNTGGTFNVTGFSTGGGGTFTGGTVTGSTDFTNGLTANTISATTYLNIPYITGNTISVQARRTTLYTLTNTFTNITFNVTDIENDSSVISHDNVNTDRIYMYESGLYEIHYHGDVGHGTTANDFETRLYLNDLSVINGGSLSGKSSSTDRITFASNTVFSASSGDYITLQARFPALTSGSIGNLVLSVKQLKGLKGDIGAIGPQGPQGTGLFTGGTISSPTEFTNGLTANTISATTYQNLPILSMKSDTVAAGSFTGNPKKYTVTFTTAYPNTNYTISITGSDNRTFTYESKATTGFVINTNANTVLTGNVDWQTIAIGES